MNIPFYSDYFKLPPFTADKVTEHFKNQYISQKLQDNKIYKFVKFDDNDLLNQIKLDMLSRKEFWASCYTGFTDKRELYRKYNIHRVTKATRRTMPILLDFFDTVNEMNDVSCFTYKVSPRMWNKYANFGNGFCIEFTILNTDKFFPVIYLNKDKVNYTNDIIKSFHAADKNDFKNEMDSIGKLSILPWVLKDKKYAPENEIRFLSGDVYDDENGPMGGRIAAGKKKAMGYKGFAYTFEYAGMSLDNITISENCSKLFDIQQICRSLDVPCVKIVV